MVQTTIDILEIIEIIIEVIIWYHGFFNSIINDPDSISISKFMFFLYYFLGIKQKLFTAFHPQIDNQIKRQNSMIEAYFQAFINFE